ncbi:MAG TPA: tRNA-dihydrouridine synthase [Patescibacteria group bacterium]|nr:tRNA-dihydrouridine synthase [Patescibacteria group bacterium]
MKNIWKSLKRPIFVLAPMDDVTDTVFRQIIGDLAAPDLYFTEFTSIDGLVSEKGREAVSKRLQFTEKERPIIAQIWGNDPVKFYEAAKIIKQMGFDGIDINMGCPEKSVVKRGMCSGLINNPSLAAEIIEAVREGSGLPVSVKTRIGFRTVQTEEWLGFLLKQNLDALIIHARTVKEMSKVPAHWEEIAKAVELRNKISPGTLIIGNGDIESYDDGLEKIKTYGVDGVMIATGIFKNLWIFEKTGKIHDLTLDERLNQLLKHTRLFTETWGETKSFAILKKFFKIYISEFKGASETRAEFMNTNSLEEVKSLITKYSNQPQGQ